jgi:abortive infection bacteriophage resistance protein
MKYTKPPLSYMEQVNLLKERGLRISDPKSAESFLRSVNYYRLSGYCLPYEESRHVFYPETTIEQIQSLYEFDRQLRFLIDEALEVIEIAIRTAVAHHLSHKYGAFVHENKKHFYSNFKHDAWIAKVHLEASRSKEIFVTHYKAKYDGFPAVPIWIAVEIMSFGALSQLYGYLLRPDQIAISKSYGMHSKVFASWIHTFSYIRNLCAHHSRLWNRQIAIKMVIPNDDNWNDVNPKKVGSVIFGIYSMMSELSNFHHIRDKWKTDILELIASQNQIPNMHSEMGIDSNFKDSPLWNSR